MPAQPVPCAASPRCSTAAAGPRRPAALQQLRTASPDNPLFSLALGTHPPPQQWLERLETAMGQRLDALASQPPVPIAQRIRAR